MSLVPVDQRMLAVWGNGPDRVAQGYGRYALDEPAAFDENNGGFPAVRVRGYPGAIVPIGDPGVGEVTINWQESGCRYTVWLPGGTSVEEALNYAARY
jgi:hypothetical protein